MSRTGRQVADVSRKTSDWKEEESENDSETEERLKKKERKKLPWKTGRKKEKKEESSQRIDKREEREEEEESSWKEEKEVESSWREGKREEEEESFWREGRREEEEESFWREGKREEEEESSWREEKEVESSWRRRKREEESSWREGRREEEEEIPQRVYRREKQTAERGSDSSKRNQSSLNKTKRAKKQKMIGPVLVAIIFIVVVLFVAFLSTVIKKYSPSKERADLEEYYHIQNEDDVAIIMDGQRLEEVAKYWDEHVYLNYKLIQQYLNQRFYWDSNENILRYTTDSDLISVNVGEKKYTITKKKKNVDYVIVKVDGENMYLALDFVQKYTNIDFVKYDSPNRVKITASWGDIQTATIKKNTEIRVKGGIKSPIVADIEKGNKVTIIEKGENWSRVCTEDGMVGYLKNKRLNEIGTEIISREFEEPLFTHLLKEEPVSLAWHQVTNQEANGRVTEVLKSTKGINVISPTWFYLNDNDGNIFSLANREYVDYCHQNNIEVWALVSNLENLEVDTTYVLTHTSTRDYLTNQIIAAAIEFNLDGINLDFEALQGEIGDAYIQFIRELSLKCEKNSLVLSIDNYVPSSYTAFYNRAEQAVFADYVIIMAYDEHNSASEDIGSVASLGFVKEGVENTIKEVPPEQTILGMPFYSRVWELTPKDDSGEDVESASENFLPYTFTCIEEGMQTIENRYTENGAQAVWSEVDGQYIAEYEKEGKTYKMWIENETSIEEKLKVMKQHKLAGVAYWKLGFERTSVWDTIIKYVN